jgi:hypothetical protein
MHKNTDLHLKISCHSKKTFRGASSGTVPGAKKRFCEDTGIDFFGEVFLGFLIGVITAWVHW